MIILPMKFNLQRLGEKEWFSIIALALLILISYLIFPLLDGIVLGVVFAYVGRPIKHLFGKRRRLGSLAGTLCIVAPLSLIFALGVSEAISQAIWLEAHRVEIFSAVLGFVSTLPLSHLMLSEVSGSLRNIVEVIAPFIASLPFINIGRSLSLGIINFLISLPVCYFLLLDGRRLENLAIMLLPYESTCIQRRCLTRIDSILSGIYLGSFYTAIAGGITSIAIFYLFRVPRPFAMACIVFLAGLVPFLTWLVFIPTAISRYITVWACGCNTVLFSWLYTGACGRASHKTLHCLYQVILASFACVALLSWRRNSCRYSRLFHCSGCNGRIDRHISNSIGGSECY